MALRRLPPAKREFMLKDLRLFFRDNTQWSQLILLGVLLLIYLFNIKSLPIHSGERIPFTLVTMISFLNLGLAGFVLAAVAARFVFPGLSLEGRQMWLLRSSPLDPRAMLWSKYWMGTAPLLVLALLITILTNWLLRVSRVHDGRKRRHHHAVYPRGVRAGAHLRSHFPQFGTENAAQIPTSFGGVVYMMASLSLLAVIIMIEAIPVAAHLRAAHRGLPPGGTAQLTCAAGGAALLLIGATLVPLRMSAGRIERMEIPPVGWRPNDRRRPVQRHGHPSDAGHAPVHGRGRGGRRAAAARIPPSTSCRTWSPSCWARRRRCSCPRARCATRSPSRCTAAPGDEILLHELAHPLLYEAGGPGGDDRRGVPPARRDPGASSPPSRCARPLRPPVHYMPRTRVVSVEQTANIGGGVCWPLDADRGGLRGGARGRAWPAHMDGARLFNAVVATGTPARAFAAPFDSVWIDLTKGLGAPVGAVLAGSRDFIAEAWRFKQRFGGAMRQAGIIAAAGLYALRAPRRAPGRRPRARPPAGPRARRAARRGAGPRSGRDQYRHLRRAAPPASPRKRSPSGRWRGAACASP